MGDITHDDRKTSEIEVQLETHIQARLGSQIRRLRVLYQNHGVILQGTSPTYYGKQLAQHLVMKTTGLPILANEIEVR